MIPNFQFEEPKSKLNDKFFEGKPNLRKVNFHFWYFFFKKRAFVFYIKMSAYSLSHSPMCTAQKLKFSILCSVTQ